MKYILFFVLYTIQPSIEPTMGHKVFNSSQECESAKMVMLKEHISTTTKSAAICVSEAELLYYTRI